jgi:hypothetical protein
MTSQDFSESRKTQLVQALQSAGAEQVKPIKPKSEAELEADRSAAAIALNAAFLRERETRFGKAVPRVTAVDVLAEALKSQQSISNAKVRLLAIPNSLPRLLVGHTTVDAIVAVLSEAVEDAATELRPFDAEVLKSKLIEYASIEPEEPDAEGMEE